MATTANNKDGTPRKQHKAGADRKEHARKHNKKAIGTITLRADQPLGPQLIQYREFRKYGRRELAVLMGWSEVAGAANLRHFEAANANFIHLPAKGVTSINTAIKYMKALGIKKFLFII